MAIAPALLPELLSMLQNDEYGPALRRKALAILHTVLETLQASAAAAGGGWWLLVAVSGSRPFTVLQTVLAMQAAVAGLAATLVCGCGASLLLGRDPVPGAQTLPLTIRALL